jgi:hypothetical protein
MTGQPDWQADLHKTFTGFSEAFAKSVGRIEAQKRREGEDGYLPHHVAWECAAAEYTWRGKHAAMRKAKGQWQALYKVVITTNRKRYENLVKETAARRAAEVDRDEYKARWKERSRELGRVWDEARKELIESRAAHAADRENLDKAYLDLSAMRVKAERLRAALDDVIGAFTVSDVPAGVGADLMRERNDAIECSETLRAELAQSRTAHAALRESLDTVRCDLDSVRAGRVRLIDEIERLRKALAKSRAEHAVDVETLRRERERADRIKDANMRLGALREADRTGRDADEVLTEMRDTGGVLVTHPREGSRIRDVVRPGGTDIGYLRPFSAGWNAYVCTTTRDEKFVGWYEDLTQAARAVDRKHGR